MMNFQNEGKIKTPSFFLLTFKSTSDQEPSQRRFADLPI